MEVKPVAAVQAAAAETRRRLANTSAITSSPSAQARRAKLIPPRARSASA